MKKTKLLLIVTALLTNVSFAATSNDDNNDPRPSKKVRFLSEQTPELQEKYDTAYQLIRLSSAYEKENTSPLIKPNTQLPTSQATAKQNRGSNIEPIRIEFTNGRWITCK